MPKWPAYVIAAAAAACAYPAVTTPPPDAAQEDHAAHGSAAEPLAYTSWQFVAIDGRATQLTGNIYTDDRYAVDFGPDMLVGYGGCNRFSARYTRSGDLLTASAIASTRRACAEPFMSLERRLFEILSKPVRISFPGDGARVLAGADGSVRLRRPSGADE